jgi:hypothetical protein
LHYSSFIKRITGPMLVLEAGYFGCRCIHPQHETRRDVRFHADVRITTDTARLCLFHVLKIFSIAPSHDQNQGFE